LAASRSSRKRRQLAVGDSADGDATTYDLPSKPKKRKTTANPQVIDLTADNSPPKKSPKKRSAGNKGKDEEKRMRRFRAAAPQSYLEIKARALSQRLTVISRERVGTDETLEERVTVAGSTGNVYTLHIGHVPSCDCPHAKKGNQCKHIIYVMLRVLKAPEKVGYQLALTSSELRDLFRNAAPIPITDPDANEQPETETNGNRKPIEGECCICYTDLEPGKEAIVYCRAACGNNIHKQCMQSWIAAKAGKPTCPYCRAQWEQEDAGELNGKVDMKSAKWTDEGYVNIAGQLGLSGQRDYSTYHQPWVRNR
ncbi:hypothetical protein K491DRAFT_566855, partial [Lophiostoma macrostomum CBS 122681]